MDPGLPKNYQEQTEVPYILMLFRYVRYLPSIKSTNVKNLVKVDVHLVQ